MSSICLVELAYDSGRFNERMGAGPVALLESGLAETLQSKGFNVQVMPVRLPPQFYDAGRALVDLQRRAVPIVKDAIDGGELPILLSGNCATAALTAVCAIGPSKAGVVWFDAHGDFNTPETSASGFLDGMALAILVGRCWPRLAERFDGFQIVPEKQIIQIGVRNTDDKEQRNLEKSAITRIGSAELPTLKDTIQQLSGRELYVHVDVDVLDVSEGHANSYACAGGLTVSQLSAALELIRQTSHIAVASITAYDPAADSDGRIGRVIPELIALLSK